MAKDKITRARELNLKMPYIRVSGEKVDLTELTRTELRAMKAEFPGIVLDPEKEKAPPTSAEKQAPKTAQE
jgi:hypothetical protein